MEALYSIGKMSEIMGISTQVLRHYCNIGLITPERIDPHTGYRYFSFAQFHYIDRARYLLRCGFLLKEIKEILDSNDLELLVERLRQKQAETCQALHQAEERLEALNWYESYFTYGSQTSHTAACYMRHFPPRWLLAIHCQESYVHRDFYPLFQALRRKPEFRDLQYRRQFTAVLDHRALLKKAMRRYRVGMFTLEPPGIFSPDILEIPAGDYWCFQAPILKQDWDPHILETLIREHGEPKLLLSNEYEDNLQSYQACLHEVQVLF